MKMPPCQYLFVNSDDDIGGASWIDYYEDEQYGDWVRREEVERMVAAQNEKDNAIKTVFAELTEYYTEGDGDLKSIVEAAREILKGMKDE